MNRREQLDAALEAVARPLFEATGAKSWAALEDGAGCVIARWPSAAPAERGAAGARFQLATSGLVERDLHLVLGGAFDAAARARWGPAAARLCAQVLERDLELEDLAAELGRCFEERVLLRDLARELGGARNEAELCERFAERSLELVGAERAFLALRHPWREEYEIISSRGFRSIERGPHPIERGLTGAVLREGGSCLIADVLAFPPEGLAPFEECASRSLLLVPLREAGSRQVLGVLGVQDAALPGGFGGDEERLLAFLADHLAAVLGSLRRGASECEARCVRIAIEALLPSAMPELSGFDVAARLDAAPHGGSTCFDALRRPDGSLAFLMLEVSARGATVPSHLAGARAALRSALLAGGGPHEAIAALNAELDADLARAGCVLSAAAVVLSRDGELRLAGAGHPPALVKRAADAEIVLLEPCGWIAGVQPGSTGAECCARLAPGDTLLLPSMGAVTATAAAQVGGPPFGIERLRAALAGSAASTSDELIRDVLSAIESYAGAVRSEDRALLAVCAERSVAPLARARAAARAEVGA